MLRFNPWWGCQRVSPGCEHCYAQTYAERMGYHVWESDKARRQLSIQYWNQPLKWNKKAEQLEQPFKVFCGSMCDIFEENPAIDYARQRLWKLISDTPSLTWLLLTKRPENIATFAPTEWVCTGFPQNVWLGVTVESQHYFHRVAQLDGYPVNIFVSVEPMLGPVSLQELRHVYSWVIIGGESGKGCRPMELSWVHDLVKECEVNHVPVFVKQLGGYPDKRDDPEKYPELAPREFPNF